MIDNIITNTLLPSLSREFLKRSLAKETLKAANVTISAGDFSFCVAIAHRRSRRSAENPENRDP